MKAKEGGIEESARHSTALPSNNTQLLEAIAKARLTARGNSSLDISN